MLGEGPVLAIECWCVRHSLIARWAGSYVPFRQLLSLDLAEIFGITSRAVARAWRQVI